MTLEKQKQLASDFKEENQDSILTFRDIKINDLGSKANLARNLDGKTTEEVYNEYKSWCESLSLRPEPPKSFTRKFSNCLPSYVMKKVLSLSGAKFNCYCIDPKHKFTDEDE